MNVNDGPVWSRQYVANPPFFGSKVASITTPAWQKNPVGSQLTMAGAVFAFCAVLGGLYLFMQSYVERSPKLIQQFAGCGFLAVCFALEVRQHGRRYLAAGRIRVVRLCNDSRCSGARQPSGQQREQAAMQALLDHEVLPELRAPLPAFLDEAQEQGLANMKELSSRRGG